MLAVILATLPQPIDLDALTLDHARRLSGRLVAATFLNAAPPYTLVGRTVVGPADREDGAVRTAVFRDRRLDVEEGRRVGVVGVLRVIDHAPCLVGTVFVPGWVELRVEETP
jgi:hypothetical protein